MLGYSAWGEEAFAIVTAPTPTTFGYTGQRREESLGLYFYGARSYDPYTSHFISADTIVPDPYQPLDWDRFSYGRNNPVKYVDPSGHFPIPVILAVVGIAIFMSQVPSDVYQSDPSRQGSAEIQLLGIALISPWADAAATSVECLSSGCDPVVASMSMLPGPSPVVVDNAFDVADNVVDNVGNNSSSRYTKTEFQGRTVYQNNDIDWDRVDDFGLSNRQRAAKGVAPIGPDGQRVNLHHLLQEEPGPMVEVQGSVHQRGQRPLHGLRGKGQSFRNDPRVERQYDQFRKDYWKAQGKSEAR